jgi:two-component sensor histidine kinase
VKNNLAAILGILALELQQPYKEAADFRASLRDLQSRIQGMTTVHNMLSDAQWSPLAIDKLVAEIIHVALSGSPIRHKIKVVVTPPDEPILIAPKQATGLANYRHELTTNSIKYAFRERNEGIYRVKITKSRRMTGPPSNSAMMAPDGRRMSCVDSGRTSAYT